MLQLCTAAFGIPSGVSQSQSSALKCTLPTWGICWLAGSLRCCCELYWKINLGANRRELGNGTIYQDPLGIQASNRADGLKNRKKQLWVCFCPLHLSHQWGSSMCTHARLLKAASAVLSVGQLPGCAMWGESTASPVHKCSTCLVPVKPLSFSSTPHGHCSCHSAPKRPTKVIAKPRGADTLLGAGQQMSPSERCWVDMPIRNRWVNSFFFFLISISFNFHFFKMLLPWSVPLEVWRSSVLGAGQAGSVCSQDGGV